ncbi:uncharacterized protein F4807DRAFT_463799 [Annulohypoxylon truncatum]|uniref:uncharacterized protein n=1 Tax=Annulohypoxylon truncatum TaxID=327061 RepID=UPI0020087B58|nr:uncharacterized protein F4807DRAFT_463799 [Annulohypoxylon truncatum]KAI1206309.1 hypothetical protein F4807DRAFT_463799 [Annulohypoxylon truncatum]
MAGGSESPIEITDDSGDQFDIESNDSDEVDADLKRDLLTCLNGIKTTGNVAAYKHYESFVNPGLMVVDTLIPLPLLPRDAETIKNASRQAPFGKGDETVVDTSVRNTWELDHTQFKFTNPRWNKYLQSLLTEVGRSLAITKMRAEPYKLLLYEEGAFFKRHKDSEKVPGMMATMVICLPSKHEGGSVHLSHGGKDYIFETDKTSDFDLTTLSWFSDVTHEVKPLKSGYRLVLTYNIIHVDGPRMSANLVGGQSAQLRSILVKWPSISGTTLDMLIYKLEHKYTESSLSLSTLKGRDQRVCQSLHEIGLLTGHTILLAKLNRTESEEVYYTVDDEEETGLEYIKTCEGHTICDFMPVEESDILGKIWVRTPDSEDEGDFTGNESMPAILRYHDTVVVIVPTQKLHRVIAMPKPRGLMSLASETLGDRPDEHSFQSSCLIECLERYIKRGVFAATYLPELIAMGIKYKSRTLYRETVYSSFNGSDAQQNVLNKIVQLMKENLSTDNREQPDWDFWFDDMVKGACKRSLTAFQGTMNLIKSTIQKEGLNDLIPSFQDWELPIPDKMVESKTELDMNDHDFLICQLFTRSKDSEWLTWFVSILSQRGSRKLICSVLHAIYNKRDANLLANPKGIFQSILDESAKKLALQIQDFPVSGYVTGMLEPRGFLSEPAATIRDVIEVIDQCFDLGLIEQATDILDTSCTNIYQYCPKPRTKSIPGPMIIRDFLLSLVAVLQKHQVTPPESSKNMFIILLRNILVFNPPKWPKPPRGHAHKPRPKCYKSTELHPCKDCEDLNAFLKSPDMDVCEFRMAQYRQRHLQEQLPPELFSCHSEQKPAKLIVRKLGKEHKQEMKEYKTNLTAFEDHVRALRCEYVESLLGEELYGELVLLKDIPDSDGAKLVKRGEKRKPEEEVEGSIASRPKLIE